MLFLPFVWLIDFCHFGSIHEIYFLDFSDISGTHVRTKRVIFCLVPNSHTGIPVFAPVPVVIKIAYLVETTDLFCYGTQDCWGCRECLGLTLRSTTKRIKQS